MQSALIISPEGDEAATIASAFDSDSRIDSAIDMTRAMTLVERTRYDVIFVDLDLFSDSTEEDDDFGAALKALQNQFPRMDVVMLASNRQIRKAVGYVQLGVSDFISRPVHVDEVRLVLEKLKKSAVRQSELDFLRDQFWKADALDVVQTKSPVMVDVFKKIRSVSATRTTVLLTGETGTGKSLLAKLIHQHSNRHQAQFISVHCGAIPDTLIESELFGHEKGAFTGALRKKPGKFEVANGGTIFLDEVGTLTSQAQVKLLQVLQDGTFSHVGGEATIYTNARVIAATNSDLKQMSEDGTFRKDLYYRLNVFPIHIPPLRDRLEDLPQLLNSFLVRLNREFQKSIQSVHPTVTQALAQYPWPGNVRELENLMERAYILENSSQLTPDGFPLELFEGPTGGAVLPLQTQLPLAEARKLVLMDFERRYIKELLARNSGKINRSAEEAGISTRQLHKLMRHYGISKEEYKRRTQAELSGGY